MAAHQTNSAPRASLVTHPHHSSLSEWKETDLHYETSVCPFVSLPVFLFVSIFPALGINIYIQI